MNLARLNIVALLLSALVLSGCAAVAAGAVVADEMNENDGRFDPLENTDLGEAIYD